MKTRIIMICMAVFLFCGKTHAQFIVTDPINLAQGIVNAAQEIVQTTTTAVNTINNFKETVKIFEQGKKYYDALVRVNDLISDSKKVRDIILMIGDISEIYVTNFEIMLSDNNFRAEEITAIAFGYAQLLAKSADLFAEVKDIISITTLSMTDKERMEMIDKLYNSVNRYKYTVYYYTQKTISVSYLRSKKNNDAGRIVALYGPRNDRYW
ncbi:DUF4141 domain-containing protein [Bacteroidales bacterium OttesenSCG-928-K03]|nr:DUF4141 domain-containing protein [Bacteroidales bacterium OttesenSCG-928-L14]MDL2240176.1 DUF4141 domain-containing protein [Bacteroidales bacterium OttesenSCG-928-K22]MDL2242469.1 DUF4141 domain-containing protein [Bacteroidales bacterium OttesenSCG-928-K03]